jgi:hypothetical protein
MDAIARVKPLLVTIDPVTAYLGKTDSHRDGEVRGLLAPLIAELERAHVGLLAVGHLTKDAQRAALHRPGGSVAFVAAARVVMCVAPDAVDKARRIMAPLKNNLTSPPSSLAFTFAPDGRLVFDIDPVTTTADELLRPMQHADEQTDAEALIRELLADPDPDVWPIDSNAALQAGRAHGIPERTMQYTAKRLGIQIRRIGFGGKGHWAWHRPMDPKPQSDAPKQAAIASIAPLEEPQQEESIQVKDATKSSFTPAREVDADPWLKRYPPGHLEAAAGVERQLADRRRQS